MKKLLAILLTITMVFTLTACGSGSDSGSNESTNNDAVSADDSTVVESTDTGSNASDGFELALITDLGTIDDRSFNQGAWEGVIQYAQENNIFHKYFQPADQGDDAYLNAIDLAVQSGAKVIVTPGFLFETPLFVAQDRYPDTKFILLDGSPNNGDFTGDFQAKVGDNVVSVFYAEEQSGFLAGYAAVKDGYRNLGFMGGMAVPAVVRFGLGYVQGAEYAAQELGLADGSININYHYTGTFDPSPEIQTMAAAWYNEGVEVIFSCGGGIFFSIVPAAENAGAKVIGVDGDQSVESELVITSAMKLLTKSVYDCLVDYYAGNFPGGQTLRFAADNLGVGLPMNTSKFSTFTQAEYDALYEKLVDGSLEIVDDIIEPDALSVKAVVVKNLG